LLDKEEKQLFRKALSQGVRVVAFDRAEALWEQPDGSTKVRDVTERNPGELRGHGGQEQTYEDHTIYIPRGVSNAEAVKILVHELLHPQHPEGTAADQDIAVRIDTETFMLRNNLPDSDDRVQDAATGLWHVNKSVIEIGVRTSPYYTERPGIGTPGVEKFLAFRFEGESTRWGRKH
jgi:hypothetical protein